MLDLPYQTAQLRSTMFTTLVQHRHLCRRSDLWSQPRTSTMPNGIITEPLRVGQRPSHKTILRPLHQHRLRVHRLMEQKRRSSITSLAVQTPRTRNWSLLPRSLMLPRLPRPMAGWSAPDRGPEALRLRLSTAKSCLI